MLNLFFKSVVYRRELKFKNIGRYLLESVSYYSWPGVYFVNLWAKILSVRFKKKMAYAELFKTFESDNLIMAESRFDNFTDLKNETMPAFLDRFVMVANNLKKHDPELGNHEQVKRLLDSLPPKWISHGKSIRRQRRFADYKLVEIMNKLKEMELDIKRREYDEAMSLN